MRVDVEREEDGRWMAEVSSIPGAMVEALVLRVLADRLERGEEAPEVGHVFTVAA